MKHIRTYYYPLCIFETLHYYKVFFYISDLFNNKLWYYNLFARYQLWNLRNSIAFIKKAHF